MALEIGQTIKRLRKERNLTQEELAEQLNVTAQAVSKWENGTGMPDISQIVPLACVFGVSTDVLFGTLGINADEEVRKIIEEVNTSRNTKNYKDDSEYIAATQKGYAVLLEALQRYPNNTALLLECLASGATLAMQYRKDGDAKAVEVCSESIREAHLIFNYSKDATILTEARMWLVRLYSAFGEYKLATEHANAFPNVIDMSRGSMLAWIKQDAGDTDGELRQRCYNIFALLLPFANEITSLGNAYRKKAQYEDAIRVYKSVFGIIKAVYGDEEYTPPQSVLRWLHANLANCYIRLGDIDSAVLWLNNHIDSCLTQARCSKSFKKFETPLLRDVVFEPAGAAYHVKDVIMNDLLLPCFDAIREDARFKALLDRANALAE